VFGEQTMSPSRPLLFTPKKEPQRLLIDAKEQPINPNK